MKMSLEIDVSMKMLVEATVEDEVTENAKGTFHIMSLKAREGGENSLAKLCINRKLQFMGIL